MQTNLRTITVAWSLGIFLLLLALARAQNNLPSPVAVDSTATRLTLETPARGGDANNMYSLKYFAPSPPWVSGVAQADGTFRLRVEGGSPASMLVIEVSTNLADWSPVFTNTTATDALFYTDPDAGKSPMRFYRAYRLSSGTALLSGEAANLTTTAKLFSPVIARVAAPPPPAAQPKLLSSSLPRIVDLTPYYQSQFGTESRFDGIPVWTSMDGLPFHLGGRIELFGTQLAMYNQVKPKEALGIKVGAAFDELHLIHDGVWSEVPNRAVAIIRLHYADGVTEDFPIKYNVHVLDWNRMPSEETEVLTDPGTKIVWRGPGVGFTKGVGRLFKTVLNNPRPAVPVATIDLISTGTRVTYRLVAATIALHDPRRAVTPGMPLNQPGARFDGAVNVTIVDDATGAPIAKADVFPFTQVYEVGIVIAPQLTTEAGEIVIRYPVDGTEYIGFRVTKPGYQDGRQTWRRGGIPSDVTCRLTRSRASMQVHKPAAELADVKPQLFNIDFGAYAPSKQVGPTAAGRAGDSWNGVAVASDNHHTESDLIFAGGDPSPIEVEMINLGGCWHSGGEMGVKSTMLDTFNYPVNNRGGDSTVILHQVPPGKYSVYIYGHGIYPEYYGDYTLTVGNHDYGRKQTSHKIDAVRNTKWVEGSQYVKFSGVEVALRESIEILIRPGEPVTLPDGRTICDAIICGLQLVPENRCDEAAPSDTFPGSSVRKSVTSEDPP